MSRFWPRICSKAGALLREGLDIAAEYIASQFRRAGLKPVGDDGYFQTAHFVVSEQSSEGAELTVHAEGLELRLGKDELRIESPGKADLRDVTPVKVDLKNAGAEDVAGKVIVTAVERPGGLRVLRQLKPAAVILAFTTHSAKPPESVKRLQDAEQRLGFPIVRVYDEGFTKLIRGSKTGPVRATLTLRLPPPVERPADLRKVAGVLPGSDPALRDTYILVTAHYDHLGKKPDGEGDLIFNRRERRCERRGVGDRDSLGSSRSQPGPPAQRAVHDLFRARRRACSARVTTAGIRWFP